MDLIYRTFYESDTKPMKISMKKREAATKVDVRFKKVIVCVVVV